MITPSKNGISGDGSQYYGSAEYYSEKNDLGEVQNAAHAPMQWVGSGAELLGLPREIKAEADLKTFDDLIKGKLPDGREMPAIADNGKERRTGEDIVASAPKSVSIMATYGGDERILEAWNRAVLKTAEKIQQEMMAVRGMVDGKQQRVDGEFIIALAQHLDSRPVEGFTAADLHTHMLFMNVAIRSSDSELRAVSWERERDWQKLVNATTLSEAASEIRQLGYDLYKTEDAFEIVGIDRQMIEDFSPRAKAIERELEKMGLTRATATSDEKQAAAFKIREDKEHVTHEQMIAQGNRLATEKGYNFQSVRETALLNERHETHAQRMDFAAEALKSAARHFSERQSVFEAKEVIKHALQVGLPQGVTEREIKQAWIERKDQHALLTAKAPIDHKTGEASKERWITTRMALSRDEKMIRNLQAGKGAIAENERWTPQEIQREISSYEAQKGFKLSSDQVAAINTTLGSSDRNTTWQGVAGAGKTTAVEVVKNAFENRGYKVLGIASGTQAVKELASIEVECKTYAMWAASGMKADDKTLFIGDETGMTGSTDGAKAIGAIEQNKSRGLFIGDTRQLQAVDSGSPFRIMQKQCDTSTLSEIRRQKNPEMLKIAELFSQGKAAEAAQAMGQFMHKVDIGDAKDRKEIDHKIADVAAKEYLALSAGKPVEDANGVPNQTRDNTLLLVATNSMRERLNLGIREGLKAEGSLGTQDVQARTLHDGKATKEELRQAHFYDGKMKDEDGKPVQIVIIPEKGYAVHGVRFADEATQRRHIEMRAFAKAQGLEKEAPVVLEKGQEYRVKSVDLQKAEVHLLDSQNREIVWKPDEAGKVKSYEEKQTAMAVNDKVIFKQNQDIKQPDGKEMKVFNGQKGTVTAISEDKIYIRTSQGEDVTIDKNGGVRVEHAYSGTVHSMQGATADYGIAALRAGSQINTGNQGYVGQSRFRYEIKVHTNDVDQLQKDWGAYQYQENAIDHANTKDLGQFNQQVEEKKMEIIEKEDGCEKAVTEPSEKVVTEPEKGPVTVAKEREMPESAPSNEEKAQPQPEAAPAAPGKAPEGATREADRDAHETAPHQPQQDTFRTYEQIRQEDKAQPVQESAERATESAREPVWDESVPSIADEHEYYQAQEPEHPHGQQEWMGDEMEPDTHEQEQPSPLVEPERQNHGESEKVVTEPEKGPVAIRDMPPPTSWSEAHDRAEEARRALGDAELKHDFGSPELEAADRNASDALRDLKGYEEGMKASWHETAHVDAMENLRESPTPENLAIVQSIEKAIDEARERQATLNQEVRGERHEQPQEKAQAQPETAPREGERGTPPLPPMDKMERWVKVQDQRPGPERAEDAGRAASGMEARLGSGAAKAKQVQHGVNHPAHDKAPAKPQPQTQHKDRGMEREL